MRIHRVHFFLACSALFASSVADTASQTSPQVTPAARAVAAVPVQTPPMAAHPEPVVPSKTFVDTYCVTCHNQRLKTGGLALDALDIGKVGEHAAEWEKVVVKLRAGLMPPSGVRRPAQTAGEGSVQALGMSDRDSVSELFTSSY